MKKNAFTVVELIVTFVLTMAITVFLFQIIIVLKNIYVSYGTKTELLNKQSLISYQINNSLNNNQLRSISKCGSYCLNFEFLNGTTERLSVDTTNKTFEYGSYKTTLPKDSYFGEMNIDVYISPVFNKDNKDSLITIDIPIHNDLIKNEDYGVRTVYQYNSSVTNITKVMFDEKTNIYGSLILKGNNVIHANNNVAFIDPGFIVYDKEGNIANNKLVVVENPLASMTIPYKSGKYEIKYKLKDDAGASIYTLSRILEITDYYDLIYTGSDNTHVDVNSIYEMPKCEIVSSYGDKILASDLPSEYTYNEINNFDITKPGIYKYACLLFKNNKLVKNFHNNIYVEREYVMEIPYSGSTKELKLPVTTNYTIELYGAEGGSGIYNSNIGLGGMGGYAKAEYAGLTNEILKITVGGRGSDGNGTSNYAGGFNGGGSGYYYSGGGGGATTVNRLYLSGSSSSNRFMIAAGGGGGQAYNSTTNIAKGGAGGGANLRGLDGAYHAGWNVNKPGKGATTVASPTNGMNNVLYNTGNHLGMMTKGGNAYTVNSAPYTYSGGGGGGYFGGSAGGYNGTSGGGGSGYANSSYLKNIKGTSGSRKGHGLAIITFKYHTDISGYYLKDMPTTEYKYTGSTITHNIPTTANYYIELFGAQGGNAYHNTTYVAQGGKGAYFSGTKKFNTGNKLYFNIGGMGITGTGTTTYAGGFNGGGTGYYYSGGGGGATDVRFNSNNLTDRIAVSGAGGGATAYNALMAQGGYGGYANGLKGRFHNSWSTVNYGGNAATTMASPKTGMYSTTYNVAAYLGTTGIGGNAVYQYSGGGGAGYFGGSAGGYQGSAGGGGSGYNTGFSYQYRTNNLTLGNGSASIICIDCHNEVLHNFKNN